MRQDALQAMVQLEQRSSSKQVRAGIAHDEKLVFKEGDVMKWMRR